MYKDFSYFRMRLLNFTSNIFTNIMGSTNTRERINLQKRLTTGDDEL